MHEFVKGALAGLMVCVLAFLAGAGLELCWQWWNRQRARRAELKRRPAVCSSMVEVIQGGMSVTLFASPHQSMTVDGFQLIHSGDAALEVSSIRVAGIELLACTPVPAAVFAELAGGGLLWPSLSRTAIVAVHLTNTGTRQMYVGFRLNGFTLEGAAS